MGKKSKSKEMSEEFFDGECLQDWMLDDGKVKDKEMLREDDEKLVSSNQKKEDSSTDRRKIKDSQVILDVKHVDKRGNWFYINKFKIPLIEAEIGMVLRGLFDGREVAFKFLKSDDETNNAARILKESDGHPNVLRYFCTEEKDGKSYCCFESWICSLKELTYSWRKNSKSSLNVRVRNPDGSPKPLLIKLLRDIVRGLYYLHTNDITHFNLKPENIAIVDHGYTLTGKIDNMSLARRDADGMNITQYEKNFGWRAPELMLKKGEASLDVTCITKAVDIFSLGCVLYYAISGGSHPFNTGGTDNDSNVKKKVAPNLSKVVGFTGANHLISQMLCHDFGSRPTALNVYHHPFFWNAYKRLIFLAEASNRGKHCSTFKDQLNAKAKRVTREERWLEKLDPQHQVYIKGRENFDFYDYEEVFQLLRLVRNTYCHYTEFQTHIKTALGIDPDGLNGLFDYFNRRFPIY